jgi:hypothetical protein
LGYGIGGAVATGFKTVVSEKQVLYTGDQSDAEVLRKMREDLGEEERFDVIIDDGSQVPWHQIFTLETIFDTWLKPGGYTSSRTSRRGIGLLPRRTYTGMISSTLESARRAVPWRS